jgi:predicted RNA-binding Zn ribbon-like protein
MPNTERPAAWTALNIAEAFTRSALAEATNAAMLAGAEFTWWQAPSEVQP